MHLGYNNPKADYVMYGSVLQSVSEEKDLGVGLLTINRLIDPGRGLD